MCIACIPTFYEKCMARRNSKLEMCRDALRLIGDSYGKKNRVNGEWGLYLDGEAGNKNNILYSTGKCTEHWRNGDTEYEI